MISKLDNVPEELASAKFGHSIEYYVNTYGRLSTEDVLKRYSKHYGITGQEKKLERNVTCSRCSFINAPKSELCEQCSTALTMKKALEIENDKALEISELKKGMEVWKNNIRKELMNEAIEVMRKEVVLKSS